MNETQTLFGGHLRNEEQADRMDTAYRAICQRVEEELDGLPNFPSNSDEFFASVGERIEQFLDEQLERDDPQDRYLSEVIGAALIVESREYDIPVAASEISSLVDRMVDADIQKSRVMKRKRELDQLAGAWTQPPDADVFIDRYADALNLHQVSRDEAIAALEDVSGGDGSSGRNPAITAAAAVWVGTRRSGEPVRQQDILDVSGVSESELRKRTQGIAATEGYIKLTRTVDYQITVPQEIIEWLGIDGKHVDWPTMDDIGAGDGDRLAELQILEEPTDSSEPIGDSISASKEIQDRLPPKVRWDWERQDDQDVLLLREP